MWSNSVLSAAQSCMTFTRVRSRVIRGELDERAALDVLSSPSLRRMGRDQDHFFDLCKDLSSVYKCEESTSSKDIKNAADVHRPIERSGRDAEKKSSVEELVNVNRQMLAPAQRAGHQHGHRAPREDDDEM